MLGPSRVAEVSVLSKLLILFYLSYSLDPSPTYYHQGVLQELRVRRGAAMIFQSFAQVVLCHTLFVSLFANSVRSEDGQSGESSVSRCPDYVATYGTFLGMSTIVDHRVTSRDLMSNSSTSSLAPFERSI